MSRRRGFLLSLAVILMSSGALPAYALDADGARALVTSAASDALGGFSGRKVSTAEAQAKMKLLLETYGDMEFESQQILTRYWLRASPAHQQEFANLLERFVIATYSGALDGVPKGERLDIRDVDQKGDRFIVHSTFITPGDDPMAVDWVVASTRSGKPVIADIVADGTALVPTMSADFSSVVRSAGGGLEALFEPIRRKINGESPAAGG
jgi:ABC-type transporter MlaC component